MDFYKEQDNAKTRSNLFYTLFIAVIITGLIITVIFFTIIIKFTNRYIAIFFIIYVISVFVITYTKIFDSDILKQINAKRVFRNKTNDIDTIKFLNIVDEMSIASGLSPPIVYIIPSNSINAFVYGTGFDDISIVITKGALECLDRDELQGVVAHEFAHIFSGDMTLNTKTLFLLKMLTILWTLGLSCFNDKKNGHSSSSFFFALYFFIPGFFGYFLGNILKASLNRQREYLSDAYAVEFTRYPTGLANALKKVGGSGSHINFAYAEEVSHLFICEASSNFPFHTHPPLKDRIKKLELNWDGKFIIPIKHIYKQEKKPKSVSQNRSSMITAAVILGKIDAISNIKPYQIKKSKQFINSLPKILHEYINSPIYVKFVIYSLLVDSFVAYEQLDTIATKKELNSEQKKIVKSIYEEIKKISEDNYLNIIRLSLPTLKTVSKNNYLRFKKIVDELILYDDKVDIFEWCLRYLVIYPLDINFKIRQTPNILYYDMSKVKEETQIVLSKVAYLKTQDDIKAKELFDKIKNYKNFNYLRYMDNDFITQSYFQSSLYSLQNITFKIRRDILKMVVDMLSDKGGILTSKNTQVAYAFASILHLPLSI